MKAIIIRQLKKEVEALKRLWRIYIKLIMVFWVFLGITMFFSFATLPMGAVLLLAAWYIWHRTQKQGTRDTQPSKL